MKAECSNTTAGAVTAAYDAEANQIGTVDTDTNQTITYAFDAEGQRVEKQISGGTTTVDVHDAFGKLAAEYTTATVTPACTTCYLAYDGVGSVRLVTNQSGGIVARHDYLPFGEEIPNGTAGRNGNFGYTTNLTQGFTGQESDGGTASLDYFNARHVAAVLGAFTQPDPMSAGADFINPQSWNAYGYVLGNPLGLVDPSGMDETPVRVGCPQCTVTVNGGDPDTVGTLGWIFGSGLLTYNWGDVFSSITTALAPRNPATVSTPSSTFVSPAKNGKTCPSVPAHPPNANIGANITAASFRNPVNGGVNPQSVSYVSPASTLAWFNAQVKYGGPWDYKIQGSQFEDFGNFNYGATGVAAGFDASTLLRAAGYAQRHHPQSAQFPGDPGNPPSILFNPKGGTPPYGDNPQNQQLILLGIQYAKNGC